MSKTIPYKVVCPCGSNHFEVEFGVTLTCVKCGQRIRIDVSAIPMTLKWSAILLEKVKDI